MRDTHILIIEDEIKLAELLRDYLVNEGFKVTSLSRGDTAIDTIRQEQPALVLLDLMIPGLDGLSVCREIRKFSDVPVIMVTAKVEEVDRLIGLEIGADDYICKPFSPREVIARVKAVMRRAQPREMARRISLGGIVLDEDTREVSIEGKLLTLTPSEFGLLSVLVRSPGRVFSRTELLDRVQGYRFEGYDRTIDSHIKNLRKKIAEIVTNREVVITVYGVGYKLEI